MVIVGVAAAVHGEDFVQIVAEDISCLRHASSRLFFDSAPTVVIEKGLNTEIVDLRYPSSECVVLVLPKNSVGGFRLNLNQTVLFVIEIELCAVIASVAVEVA